MLLEKAGPAMSTLGQVFADAFARYTVEVLVEAKRRGILDTPDLPVAGNDVDGSEGVPAWIQAQRRSGEPVVEAAAARSLAARNRIVMELRARGMTQAELARQLKMKPSSISRILQAPERSRLSTLKKIATAIQVDLTELL
jgi:lambda repressor-like predicted transcriptional regulator